MTFEELSERVQQYFIEEFGTREAAENNLASYEIEGESLITMSGLKSHDDLTEKEMNVLKELYAEYKIYACVGNEIIAQTKQKDFYKAIKGLQERKKDNKTEEKSSKGMMIFNG